MLTAADIMVREVVTVTPETRVDDLARLFIDRAVSTLPVVDSVGRLVGIVTETDLIEQNKPLHIPTVIALFDWVLYLESERDFKEQVERMSARTVGDICTREVVTCGPAASLPEIAALMSDKRVNLVPVVEGERLMGVVGRLDIIRAFGRSA